jgi:putative membrane protein
MGAADIVPGVSGGTIALLLGIYRRLIASVRAGSSFLGGVVRLDRDAAGVWLRRIEWPFVLPLLAGILLALLVLAGLLQSLLDDYPVQMAAVFLGLIAGSIVVVWQLLRRRDPIRIAIVAVTAVIVFVLLGLQEGTSKDTVSQAADPALWAFFLSGAVAICAMILPGISGSFILVMLGMYGAVIGALTDRDLGVLVVFAFGALIGLALFSQLLHRVLSEHFDSTMALLIGLMAGSTRVLWPWPEGLDSTALGSPDSAVLAAVLLAVAAAAVVALLSAAAGRLAGTTPAEEAEEVQS